MKPSDRVETRAITHEDVAAGAIAERVTTRTYVGRCPVDTAVDIAHEDALDGALERAIAALCMQLATAPAHDVGAIAAHVATLRRELDARRATRAALDDAAASADE